jgi:hypothetical protein
MTFLLRVGATLALLGALSAGLTSLHCGWLEGLGLDWARLGQDLEAVASARRLSEELDAKNRLAGARHRAKVALAQDLIAGRTALAEAAARMGAVCDADPDNWRRLRAQERGSTDAERLCRHAIGWARYALADEPARAEEVAARLEGELGRLLEAGGPDLPRVPFRPSDF